MGIKCSLFGHAYGETAVERDREEQGSEVVITIREVETCKRCGETRVVSENKEVTTIETPEEVSAAGESEDGSAPPGGDEETHEAAGGPTTEASVGAEIVDAEAGEPVSPTESGEPGNETADSDTESGAGPETGPDVASDEEIPPPAEDDGVILDDGDDEPDRDPGEWPEETEADASDQGYGPEAADGIERFTDDDSGGSPTDGPVDDSARAEEAVEEPDEGATTGEQPPVGRAEDSEVWSETDPDLDAERPDGTVTVPDGQFRCPECEFTTPVESSSLREGDFCPECHQGTLRHESG